MAYGKINMELQKRLNNVYISVFLWGKLVIKVIKDLKNSKRAQSQSLQ